MSQRHREPRLEATLADSIVKAVMEADGVDPSELEVESRRAVARDTAHAEIAGRAIGVAKLLHCMSLLLAQSGYSST